LKPNPIRVKPVSRGSPIRFERLDRLDRREVLVASPFPFSADRPCCFAAPGRAPALPRTQRPDPGDCSTHTARMSSNWADDSGDLPPPMSGGGGGSSAPAAAPSGGCVSRLRQRHRSQSPADASAPDAPLTTTLDPSTNAEASPRTCPRTNATAPRANAGGATSAETTDVAVRHPTGAPHFFSRPRPPTTAPRRRSAAGFDFPFFPTTTRDGIARDRTRRRRHLRPKPAAYNARHIAGTVPNARAPMRIATPPCAGPSKP
jgi:hypothetical protein